MVCRSCGSVEDLDAELGTSDLLRAAAAAGFTPAAVELVISGHCRDCGAG